MSHTTTDNLSRVKTCTKCGEPKPATTEYFNRRSAVRDGLASWCKSCLKAHASSRRERINEMARARYAANPEHFRQKTRSWQAANKDRANESARIWRVRNREHVLEYAKQNASAWYYANRERALENARIYRESNKERIAESQRVWRTKNPNARKANHLRRRARKKQAEGAHTGADIQVQYDRQKGKCYWCGVQVGDIYHIDHIVPLVRGGSNGPENIVVACPPCNMSKGSKLPHEWPEGGRLL